MEQITMNDYSRITDIIMFFNQRFTLNFSVNLQKKKNNIIKPIHEEYLYFNQNRGRTISIKRRIDAYFVINDFVDFNNSVIIGAKDIYLLKYFLDNNVMPWFFDKTRVFHNDNNGNLILRGKFKKQEIPLSERTYLAFYPVVISFLDGSTKEGIRMYINREDCFVEYDINKFFEFYYYIDKTDIYTAATNLISYAKMKPYGINLSEIGD